MAGRDTVRQWVADAIATLRREAAETPDTPMYRVALPGFPGIDFHFKDESAHPTGSLKHRLARSLFLYALCNGRLRPGQAVVDASSGSTAISEAWFARRLGVPFTAVMPACTAPGKVAAVRALGGACELVDDPADVHARAGAIAKDGACHLDQFGLAERATDWRGNNNIAESIVRQLEGGRHPEPAWIVCGAGTGGTSATIGRYLRYRGLRTKLCVADPEGAAFAHGWRTRDRAATATRGTVIEGIGRPRVEPGFLFEVVDDVVQVPDVVSVGAMQVLGEQFARSVGGSSGTTFAAALHLAARMRRRGECGSIVTLLCDRGERYAATLKDPRWLAPRGLDPATAVASLRRAMAEGTSPLVAARMTATASRAA